MPSRYVRCYKDPCLSWICAHRGYSYNSLVPTIDALRWRINVIQKWGGCPPVRDVRGWRHRGWRPRTGRVAAGMRSVRRRAKRDPRRFKLRKQTSGLGGREMPHQYQPTSYYSQAIGRYSYPNAPGSVQYSGMGQPSDPPPPPTLVNGTDPGLAQPSTLGTAWIIALRAASLAGGGASAYHGYKRNNSIGWALWWGFWGGIVPFFTIPVAYAQGFGKRKSGR